MIVVERVARAILAAKDQPRDKKGRFTVVVGGDDEWVEDYHSVGRVMSFTKDKAKAKRFDYNYGPSQNLASEVSKVSRELYQRRFWVQPE